MRVYSEKTANSIGPKLLVNVGVISRAMKKRAERTKIDANYVPHKKQDIVERRSELKPILDTEWKFLGVL